jgi:hypothetical protein
VLSPQNFFNTQQLGKKKKKTNKQKTLPKKYQLRRTRKPTNPDSSANTERGVLTMFCCKGAKGYQGLQMSSSREKNKKTMKKRRRRRRRRKKSSKATNRVVKTTTGWMESAKLSAENHPWALEMEGKLGWAFFLCCFVRKIYVFLSSTAFEHRCYKSTKIGVSLVGEIFRCELAYPPVP